MKEDKNDSLMINIPGGLNYWVNIESYICFSIRPQQKSPRIKKANKATKIHCAISIAMNKKRNDWVFKDIDPAVENCKRKFISEISLLSLRTKPEFAFALESWLQGL